MNTSDALNEMLLDYRAAGRSDATIKAYRSMVGAFCARHDKPLAGITRVDVRDYLTELRERPAYQDAPQKPQQVEPVTLKTVETHYRHLRAFFNWAIEIGLISSSPMAGLKKPRPPKQLPKSITPRQFMALMQAARFQGEEEESIRNIAILALLGDTGARIGELLSLKLVGIDLADGRARVTSKGHEREIYFTTFTASLIGRYIDTRQHDSEWLFVSVTTGGRLTSSGVYQMLQRVRHAAGVKPKISAHRFRHGFAVEFVKAGGDISILANLLGHDSITTTDEFYAIFSGDELKQIHGQVDVLSKMMGG